VTGRQKPEFVIGFAVTPAQALEKFRQWIADNAWYRPGDLRLAQIAEKQRGVYLPFWSFSALAGSQWQAGIGEYWYKTETYTVRVNNRSETRTRRVQHTEWWNLRGQHHRYVSGYLVSASRGLPQQAADSVNPFHLAGLKRYDPRFLAGWLCEEYSLERDDAWQRSEAEFRRRIAQAVSEFLPGDTHRDLRVDTQFSQVNSDLILLPIYLLSYRHQNKIYRFLVNGQTGGVAGDKPVSWQRITAAIVTALILIVVVVVGLLLAGALQR
jgi:hypothetical protein